MGDIPLPPLQKATTGYPSPLLEQDPVVEESPALPEKQIAGDTAAIEISKESFGAFPVKSNDSSISKGNVGER